MTYEDGRHAVELDDGRNVVVKEKFLKRLSMDLRRPVSPIGPGGFLVDEDGGRLSTEEKKLLQVQELLLSANVDGSVLEEIQNKLDEARNRRKIAEAQKLLS